jgi:hypothetical protein
MRPMRLGLLAALIAVVMAPTMAFAASAPTVTSDARKAGMAEAPAVAQAAGLNCQISDARLAGKTSPDKKTGSLGGSVYEVACGANSIGFLIQTNGTAATAYSCIGSNYPADLSKPTSPCILPANIDLIPAVDALAAKSNAPCAPTKIRTIGQTSAATLFEVACADGHDFIMSGSVPLDTAKPATIVNCLQTETSDAAKCKFTDAATRQAAVDKYATTADASCQVKDRRYIGPLADGTDGYEFSCQSGKGFILKIKSTGAIAENLDCAKLSGGGCTLTDTRAATAEQAGLYTKLAKNAGSTCTVSRYAVFPAQGDKETVELVCSDGNGAIGIFPATGKGIVLDCGHALVAGFKCTLGKVDYTGLTNDLKKFDKKECTVSSTGQPLKAPDGSIRLEVACSDGLPGYMIQFTDAQTAKDVTACTFAGNCVLPTNKKKG